MAVLEGVEGIPALFVAWDQPDVFRLGTGFEFQTLVRNCLKCQRKYCFLQLNTTLALSEWLTTFYLETPYAPVADVYICICSRGGGGKKTSLGPCGLPPRGEGWRRGPLRRVGAGPAPLPPASSEPHTDSTSPSSGRCCRWTRSGRRARPTGSRRWLALRGSEMGCWASSCSPASYAKQTQRNKGLPRRLSSSAGGVGKNTACI